MRLRSLVSSVLLAPAVVLAPTAAPAVAAPAATAAESQPSPFVERPTALYLQLGLGTPVGSIGLEAERMLSPTAAVAAGGGMGASGPQAAAMVRLLLGGPRSKVVVGAGISGGHYHWIRFCMDTAATCPNKAGNVAWTNLELGGAHRSPSGFSARYFLGYGRIVAGNFDCVGESRDHCVVSYRDDGKNLVYVGFALGYAF